MFVLILHVPLVSPHYLMPLYEFIPLLIHFNFSRNVSVTGEQPLEDLELGSSQPWLRWCHETS
jgi:hypothetical protein